MSADQNSRRPVPYVSSPSLRPTFRRGITPFLSSLATRHSTLATVSCFQSLTNCPRFATHSEPLSFQPITDCPFCKSFVLIFIQHAGGVGVGLWFWSQFSNFQMCDVQTLPVSIFFRINTCEPLVTVDSKRLTQTLNPLDATLTKKPGVGGSPANLPTCKRASSDTCPEGVHRTYYWSRRTLPANSRQAKFLCFGTPRFGTWTPTRSGSSFPVGGCDGQVFS